LDTLKSVLVAGFLLALGDGHGRTEMIEFLRQMPANVMIFFTVAVLSLAAILIVLRS
jgi:hypothetical protein